jgi:hypothetical protein
MSRGCTCEAPGRQAAVPSSVDPHLGAGLTTLQLPHLNPDSHPVLGTLAHAFWAVCGAIVVLFIFFAALGAIDPSEAVEVTAVVLVLTVLWTAHAWRGLWQDEQRGPAG